LEKTTRPKTPAGATVSPIAPSSYRNHHVFGLSGLFPITAPTESTNTRAFVTVRFNKHQTVSTLEVRRFFKSPFLNDYSYLLDPKTDRTLEAVRRAARQAASALQSSTNQLGPFCCSRTLRATLRYCQSGEADPSHHLNKSLRADVQRISCVQPA